ncbi:serine/threonine protein kinase [Patescibacteria group bacterium]|nr:serine/threonine protein kinase [Patescibacteria group bacterium]
MNIQELQIVHDKVVQAEFPEDIFGSNSSHFKVNFRHMAKIVHPDLYSGAKDSVKAMAHITSSKLNDLYERAKKVDVDGTYGLRKSQVEEEKEEFNFVVTIKKQMYHLKEVLLEDDFFTIYGGYYLKEDGERQEIIVKIANTESENDFIENDLRISKILQEPDDEYDFGKHLPVLLGRFKTSDNQLASIWQKIDGYDLFEVREKYPKGVPQEHVVWMLNRILTVLGFAHEKGIVHGNIDPSRIFIRPRDHNGWLCDWSCAVNLPKKTGEQFKVWNKDYSAPEVKDKASPLPSADMYSLGKTMMYLLGGDVLTNEMPSCVDIRLQRLIRYFVLGSPYGRASDAWQTRHHLREIRREVFGPDRFREFRM